MWVPREPVAPVRRMTGEFPCLREGLGDKGIWNSERREVMVERESSVVGEEPRSAFAI